MKPGNKFTEKQFKALLRPLYCSTLRFGYTTPEKVEESIDLLWKNELEIRRLNKQECRMKVMKEVKAIMFWVLVCSLFIIGSCVILKPTPKNHVKHIQESNVPFTKVF